MIHVAIVSIRKNICRKEIMTIIDCKFDVIDSLSCDASASYNVRSHVQRFQSQRLFRFGQQRNDVSKALCKRVHITLNWYLWLY